MTLLERLRDYIAGMAPEHKRREAGKLLIECEVYLIEAERMAKRFENDIDYLQGEIKSLERDHDST